MNHEEKLAKACEDLVNVLKAERSRVEILHAAIDDLFAADSVEEMQGCLLILHAARLA